jgi:hypothetical protein
MAKKAFQTIDLAIMTPGIWAVSLTLPRETGRSIRSGLHQ